LRSSNRRVLRRWDDVVIARPESRFPLPGGWVLSDPPTESRRYGSAVLRPLTGYEEEWLADHREPSATCTRQLLDACILGLDEDEAPPALASRMLVGDRDYLMLQLRRLTFGDRVQAVVNCPSCKSKMDVDFDAASIPLERGAPDSATYEVALPAMPDRPSQVLRFRLPCGGDQEAALGLEIAAASETVLRRCLVGGEAVPLTPEEKLRVIEAMESRAPRVELELDLACPECRRGFVMPFDMTAFFLDELRTTAAQLLREVHGLAFYYHWSESEILGLRRDRRRIYLALLSDLLRQE
jgi:hypothetical protein